MLAARFGDDPGVISALLGAGARVTLKDTFGKTALDYIEGNSRLREIPAYEELKKARD